jgi:hypothetical protein
MAEFILMTDEQTIFVAHPGKQFIPVISPLHKEFNHEGRRKNTVFHFEWHNKY